MSKYKLEFFTKGDSDIDSEHKSEMVEIKHMKEKVCEINLLHLWIPKSSIKRWTGNQK